jgi:hypothetical protein
MSDDEIVEILKFLSSRMTISEKRDLFIRLGVSRAVDISNSENKSELLEILKVEKRKRTRVLDIKFQIPEGRQKAIKSTQVIKAYKSHVDKCMGDED